MDTVRETKRADELKEGDWTAPGGISALAAEVLFAVTYPSAVTDNPRTHLVLRESGITLPFSETYAADFPVGIATVQELESTRANADRAQKIATIRALADFLERNPEMPAPSNYDMQLSPGLDFLPELDLWNSGHDGVAEVRRLAGLLGASVVESADRTSATIRVGDAEYRLIAWHKDGRPTGPVDDTEPKCTPECDALTNRPEITGMARSFHADNCPVVVHHHVTDGETACGRQVSGLPAAHGYETGGWDITDCQACIASRAGRCGWPCERPDGHSGTCSADES